MRSRAGPPAHPEQSPRYREVLSNRDPVGGLAVGLACLISLERGAVGCARGIPRPLAEVRLLEVDKLVRTEALKRDTR